MPSSPSCSARAIDRLLSIMDRLRDPQGGCPWDLEQSFATIAPHTIEEAYEVVEAIESGDRASLKDELGDLLFQVVFYARLGKEEDCFDFESIAEAISEKMLRRHPHVFGDADIKDAASQTAAWEATKAAERAAKKNAGTLDGVSTALPALTRALKLQNRAARVGFDWPEPAQVLDKIEEEIGEVGDLLFACVNLARKLKLDPETALRRGNAKFERRFRSIEAALAADGRIPEQSGLQEMEELWIKAKQAEKL